MTNDLISRSDLKKAINTYDKFACLPSGKLEPFRNLEHSEMFEPYVHLRDIRNAIDNAPTVFDCRSCKNNGNERECVDCHDYFNYVHYENRQQGVWIEFKGGYYKCDKCGEVERAKKNFCSNCGAKMKGGAE